MHTAWTLEPQQVRPGWVRPDEVWRVAGRLDALGERLQGFGNPETEVIQRRGAARRHLLLHFGDVDPDIAVANGVVPATTAL